MPKRTSRYSTKLRRAAWHAIAVKGGYVVRKTRDPRIRAGRFAFGPFRTKREACRVASYQAYGKRAEGCE
jgi:hypothetical protein